MATSSLTRTRTSTDGTKIMQLTKDQSREHENPFADPLDPSPGSNSTNHLAYRAKDVHDTKDSLDSVGTIQSLIAQARPAPTPGNLPRQYFANNTWSNGIAGVWALTNDIPGHYIPRCSAAYEILFPSNFYHHVRITQKPWRDAKDLPEVLFLSSTSPRHFTFEPFLVLRKLPHASIASAPVSDKTRMALHTDKIHPLKLQELEFGDKPLEEIMTDLLYATMKNFNRTTTAIQRYRVNEVRKPHQTTSAITTRKVYLKAMECMETKGNGIVSAAFAVMRAEELCAWLKLVAGPSVNVELLEKDVGLWRDVVGSISDRVWAYTAR